MTSWPSAQANALKARSQLAPSTRQADQSQVGLQYLQVLHKWEPPTTTSETPKLQPIIINRRIVTVQAALGHAMHHVKSRKAPCLEQIQSTHHINGYKYQNRKGAEGV